MRAPLAKALVSALCSEFLDRDRETLRKMNNEIYPIVQTNIRIVLDAQTNEERRSELGRRLATSGGAFVYLGNVYPAGKAIELVISNKGTSATILDESLHQRMDKIITKYAIASKGDLRAAHLFVRGAVSISKHIEDAKLLLPLAMHLVIDCVANEYVRYVDGDQRTDKEYIDDYLRANVHALKILRRIIVKRALFS